MLTRRPPTAGATPEMAQPTSRQPYFLKCGITSEANISMLRLVSSSESVPNCSMVTRLLTPVRSTISLIF